MHPTSALRHNDICPSILVDDIVLDILFIKTLDEGWDGGKGKIKTLMNMIIV